VDTSQLRQATKDLGVTVRLHPATAGGGARVRAGDLQPFTTAVMRISSIVLPGGQRKGAAAASAMTAGHAIW